MAVTEIYDWKVDDYDGQFTPTAQRYGCEIGCEIDNDNDVEITYKNLTHYIPIEVIVQLMELKGWTVSAPR